MIKMSFPMKLTPRGIRNNNPFNIKKSSLTWLGKVEGSDPIFETFSELTYGVRAGLKLLSNYIKRGYDTPSKIIKRFAPSTENNVDNYIDFVIRNNRNLRFMHPDDVFTSYSQFLMFCSRILQYENFCSPAMMENLYFTPSQLEKIIDFYGLRIKELEK